MNQLANKVAIITGVGLGNIGCAIAKCFAREGCAVILSDRADDALTKVALEIADFGGRASFAAGDVSSEETWENLYHVALQHFGKVDIVVNNAAKLASEKDGSWPDKTHWEQTFAVNVIGPYLSYKQFVPVFQSQGCGVFVNIASTAGSAYEGSMNAYSASKAALLNLSRNAAALLGPAGIRSVCLSPNFVPVPHRQGINVRPEQKRWQHANTPLPYLGKPEDIAQAALFLASDAARYITGIDLPVDGGFCAQGFISYRLVQDAWQAREQD